MSDYISRKDVIAALNGLLQDIIDNHQIGNGKDAYIDGIWHGEKACAIEAILRIKALPAEDVKPVVRGHFGKKTSPFTAPCSECGTSMNTYWNYCPHCGADIRGEESNERVH